MWRCRTWGRVMARWVETLFPVLEEPGVPAKKETRLHEDFAATLLRLSAGEMETLPTRLQAMTLLVYGQSRENR